MITERPRKDGTTAYYVTVEYPTRNGKRDRRSGTFDTPREARKAERAWQTEADHGGRPPSQQTLKDYLAAWLDGRRHTVERTTHANYAELLDTLIVPRLGHVRLDRLTAPLVQQTLGELRESGRKDGRGGLSSSRVNGARRVLAMALGDAASSGILERDPMPLVRAVKEETREYPEWTDAHLDRFIAAALATPVGPYWVLALVTGMRRGELLGLRWQDINWEVGRLHLRQQYRLYRNKADRGNLKRGKPRAVHLGPAALAILAEHQTRQKAKKIEVRPDWEDHDLVFCRDDGKPWNPSSVTHMFIRIVQREKLPRIKLHLLRAINASVSVAEGADPRTLADRLGHARPSTTQDHYLLKSSGRQREVAEAVEEAILRRSR